MKYQVKLEWQRERFSSRHLTKPHGVAERRRGINNAFSHDVCPLRFGRLVAQRYSFSPPFKLQVVVSATG